MQLTNEGAVGRPLNADAGARQIAFRLRTLQKHARAKSETLRTSENDRRRTARPELVIGRAPLEPAADPLSVKSCWNIGEDTVDRAAVPRIGKDAGVSGKGAGAATKEC
jgi:hypothetical protein